MYASDEWQITDQWRIDLGARYEKVAVEGSVERSAGRNLGLPGIADDNLLAGTGVFDRFDTDFDDFGWTSGVNWQFLEHSGVFVRYTSTFRLPNVGDYISNASATPIVRTMDFIEAGYKFASERLALYATVFDTKFDSFGFNDAVFNPQTGSFDTRRVFTDTETLGVELEGTFYANDWFDVAFNATWQEPEFGDFVQTTLVGGVPVVIDATGNQLQRVPQISFRLTPALNLLNEALRVELDYQHFGDRYADAANLQKLPSYDVVNANLRYAVTDRIHVYLRGENLFDEVGLTEGNPRAGTFVSGEANSPFFVARPIFGRNYRFSLLWDF